VSPIVNTKLTQLCSNWRASETLLSVENGKLRHQNGARAQSDAWWAELSLNCIWE